MKAGQSIERIEFTRPPDLPGVECLLVENSARRWRAFHETYTVSTGLKLRGPQFEWRYRRNLYRSDAGNTMLMEPGEVHANTKPTASADFRVLFISPALIEQAAIDLGLATTTPHLSTGLATDRSLFTAFARLHASLERDATPLERQSRFASCIRLLLARCTESPVRGTSGFAGHPGLSRARAFIQEHYRENLTLDELANAAGLSRFHLVRAFVAEFGLPPHAYQLHLRLARARGLIAGGEPAAVVAADFGFSDESHFNRHFNRIFGLTPGRYRQQVGQRAPPILPFAAARGAAISF